MNKTLKIRITELEKKEIEIINKYDNGFILRNEMINILNQISKELKRLKKLKREFGKNYLEKL